MQENKYSFHQSYYLRSGMSQRKPRLRTNLIIYKMPKHLFLKDINFLEHSFSSFHHCCFSFFLSLIPQFIIRFPLLPCSSFLSFSFLHNTCFLFFFYFPFFSSSLYRRLFSHFPLTLITLKGSLFFPSSSIYRKFSLLSFPSSTV